MTPGSLVLVRHGQSIWNLENRFTGWVDVDLTPLGRDEARSAARELAQARIVPDRVFTSVLKRAIRTQWLMLEELDLLWLPVERDWRLNERHYGALQGLDKAETALRHGEEQVKIWRRSYDIPPPALSVDDPQHPRFDRRYASIDPAQLPASESLEDTLERVQPYWQDRILPEIARGRCVLVVAHGNSLRAVVKMLDGLSEKAIIELNIPTGVPLLYEFHQDLTRRASRYLGDPQAVQAAAEAVRRQGEKRA